MSMENVREFFKVLAENEELKKKLEAASASAVQNAAAETLVQTAKEAGYDFTTKELVAAFADFAPQDEDGELGEEELETVAGGLGEKTGRPLPSWYWERYESLIETTKALAESSSQEA